MPQGGCVMICQKTLLGRGWTKTAIENYLPEPVEKRNSYYRHAYPMLLWDESDVETAEKLDEVRQILERKQMRLQTAAKAMEAKIKKLDESFEQEALNITVKRVPLKEVRGKAIEYHYKKVEEREEAAERYFERHLEYPDWYSSGDKFTEENIRRWMLNHIRHVFTTYEIPLQDLRRKSVTSWRKDEIYEKYKDKVMQKIYEVYPELAEKEAA